MRLFEFADDDPLRVKLAAVASQLKSRMLDTNNQEPMSTDALLNLLRQNDIIIDKTDIYDMVKKEPLVNIIKNINGHEVEFKGQTGSIDKEPAPDENAKIVSQMASKQAKKL
jgi:hypothetical protein